MSFKVKRSNHGEEDKKYALYVSLFRRDFPSSNPFKWIKINPFEKEVTSSFPPQPTSSIHSSITCDGYHYEGGSAAVGSILYLFGGWTCITSKYTNCVSYTDTASMDNFKAYGKKMLSLRRLPTVLTIDKKIYIFGSWALGLPPAIWAEVLDTESKSFSPLANPPDDCLPLLEKYSINGCAIIKNGEEIILSFNPCSLILLYIVEKDTWLKVQDNDPRARIGRDYRFSSRSPVINNVLYSYDPESRDVYAFDLQKYKWFQKPMKFLVENKRYVFSSWKEEISLDDFSTCRYLPPSFGGIHHLGNELLCLVFYENLGHDVGAHRLYCILFRPVVGNYTSTKPSIQAKIERTACLEVYFGGYLDSVAVCVDEKVDESARMGKQKHNVVKVLGGAATAILLCYGFCKMFPKKYYKKRSFLRW